ncbi:MAG: hypothetical protein K2X35_03100 [Bryobacteraceae bacterium]|nr:hypothetical protein [Bryobacteraceae bacterium]
MNISKSLRVVALSLAAVCAFAADVTGKWTATMEGPRGAQTTTFNLKADGEKLTGTVEGARGGPAEISDGKISGDDISFAVVREVQGNQMKILYKGKVSGNELKMQVTREGADQSREIVAKRATS